MKRLILLLSCFMLSSSMVFAQREPDRDGDGVPDSSDRCVSEAGTRANNGCPERNNNSSSQSTEQAPQNNPDDNDGDGTSNSVDACPDSGGPDWNAGCPVAETEEAAMADAPDDGPCLMIASTNINMRALPSMNADIIGIMPAGEFFPVLAILYNNNDGTSWYHAQTGFVNASVVVLDGNCRGLVQFDFETDLAIADRGIAFVYERLDILFSVDETGTLWIAARPHDPVVPIDWLTMDEPEPEFPELGILIEVSPDPTNPQRYVLAPENEPPLGITMGPIVDPSPGIVLDVSEPDLPSCTFSNYPHRDNPANSRSYLLLQEKKGYDWFGNLVKMDYIFWEYVVMTDPVSVQFMVMNWGATGTMTGYMKPHDNLIEFEPSDSFELSIPNVGSLTPASFDGLDEDYFHLTISDYSIPLTVNINCVEAS